MVFSMNILVSLKVLTGTKQGQRGLRGFPARDDKTPNGNHDMQNKKIYFLDTRDDHKVNDDYTTIVNKECLNDKFLKKLKTKMVIILI